MTPTLPPGAPAVPAPVNVSSALRTDPSLMPVTSKLTSVTAPSGPPMASRPALSGDCDAFGSAVNTVVSDTASKATSEVTPMAPVAAGSTPVAGRPGTDGGNMTSPGASGAPGPVGSGAVSRGTPLTV